MNDEKKRQELTAVFVRDYGLSGSQLRIAVDAELERYHETSIVDVPSLGEWSLTVPSPVTDDGQDPITKKERAEWLNFDVTHAFSLESEIVMDLGSRGYSKSEYESVRQRVYALRDQWNKKQHHPISVVTSIKNGKLTVSSFPLSLSETPCPECFQLDGYHKIVCTSHLFNVP